MEERVEEFLRAVAKAQRSALLLDYDGTLAPFLTNRREAVPFAGISELLQKIVDSGRTRVVIITGRNAREIPSLLPLSPFPEVWGSHGLQRLRPDGTCETFEIPPNLIRGLADANRWLGYQGLQDIAETKPGSVAVHWRALDESAAVELRERILLGWFPIAARESLKVMEFDGGVEIRVPDPDKGHAVRTILAELGAGVPVAYLGDDVTDEHAFRALGSRGLAVLVRPMKRRTAAHAWLKPPEELAEFLSLWRDATEAAPLSQSAAYSG